METLIELLKKSSDFLAAKGVENARLNAELIFAELLGCKRLDLYLMFERPMTDAERDALRPPVMRRGKREPLQYILGHTEFCDLRLKCDQRGLIPRPETEAMVDRIKQKFPDSSPGHILDLGTGTGALALALGQVFPEARVTAVDASPEALSLAKENAQANGLAERVDFAQSDWFTALASQNYDLIVSNPPYLTESEWESAEPEVRDFEPHQALVGGGDDGADDLRLILKEAYPRLNEGGLLALETGIAQNATLENTARMVGYHRYLFEKDDSDRSRYTFAWK